MAIPVALRRRGYRIAHRVLRAWWLVRRPDHHGVKCVLTNGDRVLLVRHTYGNRRWDLPGGSVRRGEAAQETASREMEEELGIRIEHWYHLGDMLTTAYGCHDTLHCLQAEVDNTDLTLNKAELYVARWFSERELPVDLRENVGEIVARSRGSGPSVRDQRPDA